MSVWLSRIARKGIAQTTLTRASTSLNFIAATPTIPGTLNRPVLHLSCGTKSHTNYHLLPNRRAHFSVRATCAEPNGIDVETSLQALTREFGTAATDSGRELPQVNEEDLEEQFVRGSGPGGQKINKTASCVVLKHKPSGIIVRCQETRSQSKNREIARTILQRKLDEIIRGEESLAARELSKARARKARRRRKSVKKHFKSRRDKALLDI